MNSIRIKRRRLAFWSTAFFMTALFVSLLAVLAYAARSAHYEGAHLEEVMIAAGGLASALFFLTTLFQRRQRKRLNRVNAVLEATVEQLNAEIARRREIERDLLGAKEQAEETSRMKSGFLATMSHELRTPMNGILGFSKILLAGDLTSEQREQLQVIDQSGEALLMLINDILDLSQLEAGKLKLRAAPFDLHAALKSAAKLLEARAQEKGLALSVVIDPALPTHVVGDAARLRQILVNLIGNAVKFTEAGAVSVFAAPGLGDEGQKSVVRISVADTGIGIPADAKAALFERFSQVDSASTRKYGGAGLGLAICKELATLMDGAIGLHSEQGKGSEFWVSLPLPRVERADMQSAAVEGAAETYSTPSQSGSSSSRCAAIGGDTDKKPGALAAAS